MDSPCPPRRLALLMLALAATPCAMAQTDAGTAPIRQVLVHPAGATVQRQGRVAAGATQLRIGCLPASFDPQTLQLSADAGIVLGDLDLQTLDRAAAPECAPQDARLRELEDQRAAVQAEHTAQDTLLAALKSPPPATVASSTTALAAYADALRRTAQEALQRQHLLTRRLQAMDVQIAALRAGQARAEPRVRQLTVRLATRSGGDLRLSYRVKAGWTPVYRAHLDTESSRVRLERLAQVSQASGEDWDGVAMRLSTSEPDTSPLPPRPRPWTLSTQPGPSVRARAEVKREAATADARSSQPAVSEQDAQLPGVAAVEGLFDTEYALPGPVRLRGDGQQLSVVLDPGIAQAARLVTRVQPRQASGGWLVAETARPAGDWPAGTLQLYRDGSFIGQTPWAATGQPPLTLGFGRDERLRVTVTPTVIGGADTGLLDKRVERRERHEYLLENTGPRPISLQVLEPTPTPQHDDIRIEARLTPPPLPDPWQQQPGIRVWELRLDPRQQARLVADYLISHPRGVPVDERR